MVVLLVNQYNGHRVSSGRDQSVLVLDRVVVVQHWECTRCHRPDLNMMNFMGCDFSAQFFFFFKVLTLFLTQVRLKPKPIKGFGGGGAGSGWQKGEAYHRHTIFRIRSPLTYERYMASRTTHNPEGPLARGESALAQVLPALWRRDRAEAAGS